MISQALRLFRAKSEWIDMKPTRLDVPALERFWIECVCCFGKMEYYDPAAVERMLEKLKKHSQWDMAHLRPIKVVCNALDFSASREANQLSTALADANFKTAPTGTRMKEQLGYSCQMIRAGQPDIKTATYEQLADLRWIPPLTAATFCFYTGRPNAFPIDGVSVPWLQKRGYDVEESKSADTTLMQMMIALQEIEALGMTPYDAYKAMWDGTI